MEKTHMYENLHNKELLLLGGTGSLGTELTIQLLRNYNLKGLRIFSRTEFNQWVLKEKLKELNLLKNISFLIGDIREYERVWRAMQRVDIVIHAAAMKHITFCEQNPFEAVSTNVVGSKNVINAALDAHVDKVMFISSDKGVQPQNLYGATKMCGEILFTNANVYTGGRSPLFSCCRYGNVLGSRGSIIPLFRKQIESGKITLTHKDMTRFWITLPEVAEFILSCFPRMNGGEIYIPKMKIAKITDIIKIMAPEDIEIEETGIRQGEKIHEVLITKEESRNCRELADMFVIHKDYDQPSTFVYTSEMNTPLSDPMDLDELKEKIERI